jgi:hypothetical protein
LAEEEEGGEEEEEEMDDIELAGVGEPERLEEDEEEAGSCDGDCSSNGDSGSRSLP